MDISSEMKLHTKEAEEIIVSFLPKEEGYAQIVMKAMNYSFLSGGKRLRPIMVLESFRLFGGSKIEYAAPFMAALEMIHTYSLVHDDLPAMDNDDLRRGRKTTHKQFDEATAILAGDGLLNYAFETAIKSAATETNTDMLIRKCRALEILSAKAGIFGMIGGQTADMEAEKKGSNVSKEELLFIHQNKTAALIQCALMMGAVLAGATKEQVTMMEQVGYFVGVAFQIQDDILDCIGDEAILGKPIGSDEKNQKVTYVTLEGLKKAQMDQKQLSENAISLLDKLPCKNDFLRALILSLVERNK